MKFNIIFNRDNNNIIGINGELPYHIKEDLEWFKTITRGHIIVMGYNTWNSIPKKPLINRYNIVITNNHYDELSSNNIRPDKIFRSYQEFLDDILFRKKHLIEFEEECKLIYDSLNENLEIFIIGGSSLYKEAYKHGINTIYETKTLLSNEWDIDSTIIKSDITIDDNYTRTYHKQSSGNIHIYNGKGKNRIKHEGNYSYSIYRKNTDINFNEFEYLNLLNSVYIEGNERQSRNSIVKSIFGGKMTFDLRKGFPLLTTKKMGWKTILRELLWFISGSTDNKLLQDKNVHIWDGNSSKEFMESRGLNYEEGDLGPIYGFQWRKFGKEYLNCNDNTGGGVDQLKEMINLIINDPGSRRILMSAWNPPDLHKMALPPCHVLFQIYVEGEFIDGQLYQRSGDMFLGVPFNIASYSFLLHIIGKITNKKPRFLYHILGDCHIYSDHYKCIENQLIRNTFNSPIIEISDNLTDIDTIKEEYFKIINYNSHPPIKATMVV